MIINKHSTIKSDNATYNLLEKLQQRSIYILLKEAYQKSIQKITTSPGKWYLSSNDIFYKFKENILNKFNPALTYSSVKVSYTLIGKNNTQKKVDIEYSENTLPFDILFNSELIENNGKSVFRIVKYDFKNKNITILMPIYYLSSLFIGGESCLISVANDMSNKTQQTVRWVQYELYNFDGIMKIARTDYVKPNKMYVQVTLPMLNSVINSPLMQEIKKRNAEIEKIKSNKKVPLEEIAQQTRYDIQLLLQKQNAFIKSHYDFFANPIVKSNFIKLFSEFYSRGKMSFNKLHLIKEINGEMYFTALFQINEQVDADIKSNVYKLNLDRSRLQVKLRYSINILEDVFKKYGKDMYSEVKYKISGTHNSDFQSNLNRRLKIYIKELGYNEGKIDNLSITHEFNTYGDTEDSPAYAEIFVTVEHSVRFKEFADPNCYIANNAKKIYKQIGIFIAKSITDKIKDKQVLINKYEEEMDEI